MHDHIGQLRSHLYCRSINDFWIDQAEGASMSLMNNFNNQNITSDLPVLYKSNLFSIISYSRINE